MRSLFTALLALALCSTVLAKMSKYDDGSVASPTGEFKAVMCPNGELATGMYCKKRGCRGKGIVCEKVDEGIVFEKCKNIKVAGTKRIVVPKGFIATGLVFSGIDYKDQRLRVCKIIEQDITVKESDCEWSRWFNGGHNTSDRYRGVLCKKGSYLAGMHCYNGECNSARIKCCKVKIDYRQYN